MADLPTETKRSLSLLLSIAVIALLVALVMAALVRLRQPVNIGDESVNGLLGSPQPLVAATPTATPSATVSPAPTSTAEPGHEYIFVAEKDGQTALELLDANLDVTLKQYDFGAFIQEVNGIKSDSQFAWIFYVNDQLATQAADKTVLKQGDKVRFSHEPVKPF